MGIIKPCPKCGGPKSDSTKHRCLPIAPKKTDKPKPKRLSERELLNIRMFAFADDADLRDTWVWQHDITQLFAHIAAQDAENARWREGVERINKCLDECLNPLDDNYVISEAMVAHDIVRELLEKDKKPE